MIKTLNLKEFSRKGGKATLAKYGREHFVSLGKKGAESKLKKYGPEYFSRLSASGVKARLEKIKNKSSK
jgi:hypothetical protein